MVREELVWDGEKRNGGGTGKRGGRGNYGWDVMYEQKIKKIKTYSNLKK